MSQTFVGSYSVETSDNENYVINFTIPDNCDYAVTEVDGVYSITISLKKGQTTPSTTFVGYKETLSSIDGVIAVDFKQPCDENTLVTKPRIRIDF